MKSLQDLIGDSTILVTGGTGSFGNDFVERIEKDFLFKEIRISSSITNRKDEMPELIDLVETKKIDLSRSVSLTLPFERINEGIERVKKNVEHPIRVVLQFA